MLARKSVIHLGSLLVAASLLLATGAPLTAAARPDPQPLAADQPIVTDLKALLAVRPDIGRALVASLEKADWRGITELDGYFTYLNEAVTRLPVADDATIEAKGVRYSIPTLLAGSPYADAFRGGVFTHAFLNVNDYHRFHTPVAGKVLESRVILGKMDLEVERKPDTDALDPLDPVGYQFTQARGLLVIESGSAGLVAVLPIGMAQVSSVTLTPEVGTELAKGEEFGFFQFGGSDIIMVFQPDRVRFTAEVNKHHLQGEKIGELIGR